MNDLVLLYSGSDFYTQAFYMRDLKICYFYDLDVAEKYKKSFKINEYKAVKFKDLSEEYRKQLCNDLERFVVFFIPMMFNNGQAVMMNCDGLNQLMEAQNIRRISKNK